MEEEKTKDNGERRMCFRIPLRVLKVNSGYGGRDIFFGYAKDLSTGGMQIQSSNPKEVGTKLSIKFDLPECKGINCEAEVIWSKDFDPKTKSFPGMGLKFLDLNPTSKKVIEEFIKKNS